MPVTDVKLAHEINKKKNSASTLKEMTDSHVEKYSSSIRIYIQMRQKLKKVERLQLSM